MAVGLPERPNAIYDASPGRIAVAGRICDSIILPHICKSVIQMVKTIQGHPSRFYHYRQSLLVYGRDSLCCNTPVSGTAHQRCNYKLDKQRPGNRRPDHTGSHIALKIGYKYKFIAENLASGVFFTNSKIVDCWMQSPGHRKNILSSQMREIGVSVIKGRLNGTETWVSVQIFGLRSTQAPIGSYTFSRREPGMEIGAEGPSGEGLHEKLRRMKQEVDAERAMIDRDLRIAGNDPVKNEEHALRVRSYNKKLDKYNQALTEIQAIRMAMNSRN
jgi:hypothetical protein